jgi:catechol-2,3-dioxygenase
MFKSNNGVAIHLKDLVAAESFYSDVLRFQLMNKTEERLEYDTGHFLLYVNRDVDMRPPIPSFTVADLGVAKQSLMENGCTILRESADSLYFSDPFGITYDIIQGK